MIIYQVRVRDRGTGELIEVSSLYDNEQAAEQEKRHIEQVYSSDTVRVTVHSEPVLSSYGV